MESNLAIVRNELLIQLTTLMTENNCAKKARLKRIHTMYINVLFHLYKILECKN